MKDTSSAASAQAKTYQLGGQEIAAFGPEEAVARLYPGANKTELDEALQQVSEVGDAVATAIYPSTEDPQALADGHGVRVCRTAEGIAVSVSPPLTRSEAEALHPEAAELTQAIVANPDGEAFYPRGTTELGRTALDLDAEGFAILVLPPGQKRPTTPGWPYRAERGSVLSRLDSVNISLILGDRSGRVVDLDDDIGCPETVDAALAAAGCPATWVHGRPGKPRSHWLFRLTDDEAGKGRRWQVEDGLALELRATGQQTVVAGSHERGPIRSNGAPIGTTTRARLERALSAAAAVEVIRHLDVWTAEGGRDEAFLRLAGALASRGVDREQAAVFVATLYQITGYDRDAADAQDKIERSYSRFARDEPTEGLRALIDDGADGNAIEKALDLLGGKARQGKASKADAARRGRGFYLRNDKRLIYSSDGKGACFVADQRPTEIPDKDDGCGPLSIGMLSRATKDRLASEALVVADLASRDHHGAAAARHELARAVARLMGRGDVVAELDRPWPPMVLPSEGATTGIAKAMVASVYGRAVTTGGEMLTYRPDAGTWEPPEVPPERHAAGLESVYFFCEHLDRGSRARPFRGGNGRQGDIAKQVRQETHDDGWSDQAASGIGFSNGFVEVDKAGIRLVPHSPDHRARHSTGVDWDPEATCPEWRAFLEKHAGGPEVASTIMELVGAALIGKATEFDTSIVLEGSGGEGKSTTVEAISALFPPGSVSSLSPQSFGASNAEVYNNATLQGKLLNAVEELPAAALTESASFKAIVGGSKVQARLPHRDPFMVTPRALHVLAANQLPQVSDTTRGFWRRVLVIPFRIPLRTPRPEMLAKFGAERAGMLAWALRSAVALLRRGRIQPPAAAEAAKRAWADKAESVAAFVQGCTIYAPGVARGTSSRDLHQAYTAFTRAAGFKPLNATSFGMRLKNVIGHVETKKGRGNTKLYIGLLVLDPQDWPVAPREHPSQPPLCLAFATAEEVEAGHTTH